MPFTIDMDAPHRPDPESVNQALASELLESRPASVAAEAPQWLALGGHLLIETSGAQAPRARTAFTQLATRIAYSDEYDASVVIATKA